MDAQPADTLPIVLENDEENVRIETTYGVAKEMSTVVHLIDAMGVPEGNAALVIPLPNLTAEDATLLKEYLMRDSSQEQFVNTLSGDDQFALIHIATYLDMEDVKAAVCAHVAERIRGKSVQDIRQLYPVYDLTQAEIVEIFKQYKAPEAQELFNKHLTPA